MVKIDKKTKKHLIISLVVFVVLLIVGIIFHVRSIKKVREECDKVNQELQMRVTMSTRNAYKALANIEKGQIITEDLVTLDPNTLDDDSPDLMFLPEDFGKEAMVDIPAGSVVNRTMITDPLDKNWQETELNCIWLSTNLKQYDYVDIRILYPDGTDYVVASKKCIKKIRLSNNNSFFWFTEDEILNVDAAIVDANLHGARIYTTRYVKPEIEEASKITYQPSASVIDLMNSSPNVLAEAKLHLSKAAREEMEAKLRDFKNSETEQKKEETDAGYDFKLDTTTNAGTGGSGSEDNNGYKPPEGEEEEAAAAQDSGSAVESARNEGNANTGNAADGASGTGGAANGQ